MRSTPIRPLHALAAAGTVIVAVVVVSALVTRAPPPVPAGSSSSPAGARATLASSPAASPTPAATATPTAAPAPGSERYGLIVGASVRSEADPRKLGEIATDFFHGAVSPDGRRVAYWEATRGSAEARVLRLLDGSMSAQSRVVLTLPESETATVSTGGGVVWSSDGTGLLIGVNSREYTRVPPVHGPALYATLRTVDLASGSVREVVRREPGHPLRPVAWDRARGIAAGTEIGGGGFVASYVVVRDGAAPIRTPLETDIPVFSVIAAPDASRVLAVRWRPTPAVLVWPLAEPERRTTMELAAGERVARALWRNAREIVVPIDGDAPAAHRLEVWPLDGPRRVLLRGARGLDAVRPDGTAAIVSGQAVDLDTGATWPIPGLGGLRVGASFLLQ